MTVQAGDTIVRSYVRRLFGFHLVANYLGIAIMVWYSLLALRVYPENRSPLRIVAEVMMALIPVIAFFSITGYFIDRKQVVDAIGWVAEDRSPSVAERERLCRLPKRLATIGGYYWAAGGVFLFPYLFLIIGFRPGAGGVVRVIVSYALIAIIPWSLSFLVNELLLRPLFGLALTSESETPRTMGVPARLLLAWIATSGLPLVGVFLLLIGQSPSQQVLAVPAVYTVLGLGTVAGITIAVISGRSLIDPISKVRSALREVEQGNLDVTIDVSDGSELGELQAGVNRMVIGLRERERMRDLFGRHVGTEVAARALAGDAGLGSERHEATAMFVDVIGSSFLVDRKDPDDVVVILNDFFDAVVRVVSAEGGIVNKFEGDGALCIFGVPIEQPDHAERALRAGQRLQQELSELPGDVGAAIGISSGTVVAGNIGAADRYEYTVIGSPVHEASRLCDEAKLTSSRILASESAIRIAGAHETGWIAADTVLLRGRSEMTATYTPPPG